MRGGPIGPTANSVLKRADTAPCRTGVRASIRVNALSDATMQMAAYASIAAWRATSSRSPWAASEADQCGGDEATPGMRPNAVLLMTDPVNSAGSASARLGQESQRMA